MPVLANWQGLTYFISVLTRDAVKRTCQEQWTIGTNSEKEMRVLRAFSVKIDQSIKQMCVYVCRGFISPFLFVSEISQMRIRAGRVFYAYVMLLIYIYIYIYIIIIVIVIYSFRVFHISVSWFFKKNIIIIVIIIIIKYERQGLRIVLFISFFLFASEISQMGMILFTNPHPARAGYDTRSIFSGV